MQRVHDTFSTPRLNLHPSTDCDVSRHVGGLRRKYGTCIVIHNKGGSLPVSSYARLKLVQEPRIPNSRKVADDVAGRREARLASAAQTEDKFLGKSVATDAHISYAVGPSIYTHPRAKRPQPAVAHPTVTWPAKGETEKGKETRSSAIANFQGPSHPGPCPSGDESLGCQRLSTEAKQIYPISLHPEGLAVPRTVRAQDVPADEGTDSGSESDTEPATTPYINDEGNTGRA
ncbi:hypothetical protein BJ912DRAFT_925767 [Pholiota molesta]|nr:hypothetical protein BJ912DRAFT_925767 [Pholiota molesta]